MPMNYTYVYIIIWVAWMIEYFEKIENQKTICVKTFAICNEIDFKFQMWFVTYALWSY